MSLDDLIRDDVQRVFFNRNDFAKPVTYSRGSESFTVLAIAVDPVQAVEQHTPTRLIQSRDREWIVQRSDFAKCGGFEFPKMGDTISRTLNCIEETYRVSKPAAADREWVWDDPDNRIFRIRTTLMVRDGA